MISEVELAGCSGGKMKPSQLAQHLAMIVAEESGCPAAWDILLAEELAQKLYSKDFYALPSNLQSEVYSQAAREYVERMCDKADQLRKAEREG